MRLRNGAQAMATISAKRVSTEPSLTTLARPVVKWAGGKTQLLPELLQLIPQRFNAYVEPFFGGGALFFAVTPAKAVISDSNDELINLYQIIATDVEGLIHELQSGGYEVNEAHFYQIRALDVSILTCVERAARTMYLNRTCFNGLYRVNRKGGFNVPYGHYKNPKVCDPSGLRAASRVLADKQIVAKDYKQILADHTHPGDFVYLDPPYLPISDYADFKRYTKEQFYKEDHVELAKEFRRLHDLGCSVVLNNSNHPLVYDLYDGFDIKVVQTRRNINSKGGKRSGGEDVIISAPPKKSFLVSALKGELPAQVNSYPTTRYMGSKHKVLESIWRAASWFEFESVLDLFSGSGVVSYMFKAQGKAVLSNDYMAFSAVFTQALIENNTVTLSVEDTALLLDTSIETDDFVTKTFTGLYFTDEENALIDRLRTNIKRLPNQTKRALAMAALVRGCLKKRPRGIFTYTGDRYNDGRKDLQTTLEDHFLQAVEQYNAAVFDNGKTNKARRGDALTSRQKADLVYIDPPYYSPLSDNEYVRRYHFVEGLARDWQGVEMQWHTKTKKFKSYPTPFSSRAGAYEAFELLFKKHRESILIVSYSSNSIPTKEQLITLMTRYKSRVEVVAVDHTYSFGNQGHKIGNDNNRVREYLFIGF